MIWKYYTFTEANIFRPERCGPSQQIVKKCVSGALWSRVYFDKSGFASKTFKIDRVPPIGFCMFCSCFFQISLEYSYFRGPKHEISVWFREKS